MQKKNKITNHITKLRIHCIKLKSICDGLSQHKENILLPTTLHIILHQKKSLGKKIQ